MEWLSEQIKNMSNGETLSLQEVISENYRDEICERIADALEDICDEDEFELEFEFSNYNQSERIETWTIAEQGSQRTIEFRLERCDYDSRLNEKLCVGGYYDNTVVYDCDSTCGGFPRWSRSEMYTDGLFENVTPCSITEVYEEFGFCCWENVTNHYNEQGVLQITDIRDMSFKVQSMALLDWTFGDEIASLEICDNEEEARQKAEAINDEYKSMLEETEVYGVEQTQYGQFVEARRTKRGLEYEAEFNAEYDTKYKAESVVLVD